MIKDAVFLLHVVMTECKLTSYFDAEAHLTVSNFLRSLQLPQDYSVSTDKDFITRL